jgi:hypothetical protein
MLRGLIYRDLSSSLGAERVRGYLFLRISQPEQFLCKFPELGILS